MDADVTAEYDLLAELADQLKAAAEAHDARCCTDCTEHTTCFPNRTFIVALVMDRMGLDVVDIGYIADKLMELQCDDGPPCDHDDSVLDADELSS